MTNNQDKRISFQSLFSSLCHLNQGKEIEIPDLEAIAYGLNNKLHATYADVAPKNMNDYKPSAYNSKPTKEGDTCECGTPRVEKTGVKNGKPWRGMFCKNRKCSPIWLPTVKEMGKAAFEDSQADASYDENKQNNYDNQHPDNEIPEEYR